VTRFPISYEPTPQIPKHKTNHSPQLPPGRARQPSSPTIITNPQPNPSQTNHPITLPETHHLQPDHTSQHTAKPPASFNSANSSPRLSKYTPPSARSLRSPPLGLVATPPAQPSPTLGQIQQEKPKRRASGSRLKNNFAKPKRFLISFFFIGYGIQTGQGSVPRPNFSLEQESVPASPSLACIQANTKNHPRTSHAPGPLLLTASSDPRPSDTTINPSLLSPPSHQPQSGLIKSSPPLQSLFLPSYRLPQPRTPNSAYQSDSPILQTQQPPQPAYSSELPRAVRP